MIAFGALRNTPCLLFGLVCSGAEMFMIDDGGKETNIVQEVCPLSKMRISL
jgi:hypothetical protein